MCRRSSFQHFRDPGCSIGSSRRKSRLLRRRNYHARGLIVTEEVPCRGPGKRATHFAKCLVHVGTILAHLAATSLSTATSSATLVSTASPRGRRKKLPSTFPAAPSRSTRRCHSAPQDELEARESCGLVEETCRATRRPFSASVKSASNFSTRRKSFMLKSLP